MMLWETNHCLHARFWLCKYSVLMLCVIVIGKETCEDKLLLLHYSSIASEVLAHISVLCQAFWMLLPQLCGTLKQANKKLSWKLKGLEFLPFIPSSTGSIFGVRKWFVLWLLLTVEIPWIRAFRLIMVFQTKATSWTKINQLYALCDLKTLKKPS